MVLLLKGLIFYFIFKQKIFVYIVLKITFNLDLISKWDTVSSCSCICVCIWKRPRAVCRNTVTKTQGSPWDCFNPPLSLFPNIPDCCIPGNKCGRATDNDLYTIKTMQHFKFKH